MTVLRLLLLCALSLPAASDIITFGTSVVADLGATPYVGESPWVVSATGFAEVGDLYTTDGPDSEAEVMAALFSVGELVITHTSGDAFDFTAFEIESFSGSGTLIGFGVSSDTGGFETFTGAAALPGTYTAGVDFPTADFSDVTEVTIFVITGGSGFATIHVDDIELSVASVPEPSTGVLGVLLLAAAWGARRR